MRRLFPLLLLAGCSQEPAPVPEPQRALYAGEGRDRLCISGDRAGFIAYGEGDANCSVAGKVQGGAGRLTFSPTGDEDCRIAASLAGGRLRLGERSAACAYYCGPNADFSGRTFTRDDAASAAVDFAGDPLC